MRNAIGVFGVICAIGVTGITPAALGIVVAPGQTVMLQPGPATGGTLLAVSAVPFGGLAPPDNIPTLAPIGTYTTQAYRETDGSLTFSALLQAGQFGALNLEGFTMNGFAGTATDVTFINAGSPLVPETISRSADGDALHVSFGLPTNTPNLPAGEFADTLLVHTNALAFTTATADIQAFTFDAQRNLLPEPVFPFPDPSSPGRLPSLAPSVPEPGTPLLMGLGGLLWWGRRRVSR